MLGRNRIGEDEPTRLEPANTSEFATEHVSRQPLVRIHLLGSLRATTYLGQSIVPRGRKARAMLGYLCLAAGERIARARLSSLLWDRVQDGQARASCRQALRELSAAMGPLAEELIEATPDTVRLKPRVCWIDAVALRSSEPLPPQSFRSDLASICTGELLEDLDGISPGFDQWLLTERTRFTEQLRRIFEGELQQLNQTNLPSDRRATVARQVIAFDPTHEGASRILMRALADMGERAQALREYERCRTALKTALDIEPSTETRALYRAVKMVQGRNISDDEAPLSSRSQSVKPGDRLRIRVMPLRGEGSRCESLAFSLSREIAAALARFRWFDVIAPVSLASSSQAAEENFFDQHLDYIVEGDLSGTDEKFQISVRLLDVTEHARPVWTDRFELAADALDRVDELVTAPVVARIDPVILFIEGRQKRREWCGATGLVLQAISLIFSMEREKYEEAGRLLAQAVERDPENAMVAAWAACWHVFYVGQGWAQDTTQALATAQKLAVKAIRIDPDNAEALGIYAHICAFLEKDFDSALHYFERSLRLNPNLPFVWALSAATHSYIGEPDIALQQLDRYRKLAPSDPSFSFWENIYTVAYMFKGEYEKAVTVGRRVVRANPDYSNTYKPLIAALGHLGRRDEAAPYIEKLLSLEPNFTAERFGNVYPIRKPEDRQRYMQGLVLAGIPAA
jgi:DNA-binding SARP family transcriptional activator/Flp pilus assembly protein TadD